MEPIRAGHQHRWEGEYTGKQKIQKYDINNDDVSTLSSSADVLLCFSQDFILISVYDNASYKTYMK